jgi:hypothetical protein
MAAVRPTVVVVGRSGAGKSAFLNRILGAAAFAERAPDAVAAQTRNVEVRDGTFLGAGALAIRAVDTPELFLPDDDRGHVHAAAAATREAAAQPLGALLGADVTTVVLVVNTPSLFDGYLQTILAMFERVYTSTREDLAGVDAYRLFLDHLVVVRTHMDTLIPAESIRRTGQLEALAAAVTGGERRVPCFDINPDTDDETFARLRAVFEAHAGPAAPRLRAPVPPDVGGGDAGGGPGTDWTAVAVRILPVIIQAGIDIAQRNGAAPGLLMFLQLFAAVFPVAVPAGAGVGAR